jgi:hypothetical protein
MIELLDNLNKEACRLAELAGKRIMPLYKNGATVTWEADASPLTSADSASHDFFNEIWPAREDYGTDAKEIEFHRSSIESNPKRWIGVPSDL